MTQWNQGQDPYQQPPQQPYPPQQPQPYPPQQPPYAPQQPYGSYQPPAPLPPRRQNTGLIVLVACLAVLAVLVVGIVVVVAVRRGADTQPVAQHQTPATSSASKPSTAPSTAPSTGGVTSGAVDACLLGSWKQTSYDATFDFSGVQADGTALGAVKVNGGGGYWKIVADGVSTEDFTRASYSGKTTDGRNVAISFTGQMDVKLKTADAKLQFTPVSSDVEMSVAANGKEVAKQKINAQSISQPYTCGNGSWTMKSSTDFTASTTWQRM